MGFRSPSKRSTEVQFLSLFHARFSQSLAINSLIAHKPEGDGRLAPFCGLFVRSNTRKHINIYAKTFISIYALMCIIITHEKKELHTREAFSLSSFLLRIN